MATLPTKNKPYSSSLGLTDLGLGGFKINPTIEVGDVKVSTDNGAFANISNLPIVNPAGSDNVEYQLTADEMNGDKVVVNFRDVLGDQWGDAKVTIDVPAGTVETLLTGVLKANTAGGFHVQMLDGNDAPVAGKAVTVTRMLDNGPFAGVSGTITNTNEKGVAFFSYSALDVNGTDAVAFLFSAPGAKDTYLPFKLSV